MNEDQREEGPREQRYRFERRDECRVVTGRGVEALLPRLVADLAPDGVVLVHDRAVEPLARRVADAIGARTRLPLEGGEDAKRLVAVGTLSQALVDAGATRGTVLVALGGGSVCDLSGFLAAVHLRGLPLVLLPTTTLAACDAALGGKNGVDHAGLKNALGTIRQPRLVATDTAWFETLPDELFREGLVEVVKKAAVLDAAGLAELEARADALAARDGAATAHALDLAVRLKMGVVLEDETEAGRRRWLNFGHTVGHALESASRLRLSHGRAVALGMLVECRAAGVDDRVTQRLAALLARLGVPTRVPTELADAALLWEFARRDKKASRARVPMVVPTSIGRGELVELTRESLERALS